MHICLAQIATSAVLLPISSYYKQSIIFIAIRFIRIWKNFKKNLLIFRAFFLSWFSKCVTSNVKNIYLWSLFINLNENIFDRFTMEKGSESGKDSRGNSLILTFILKWKWFFIDGFQFSQRNEQHLYTHTQHTLTAFCFLVMLAKEI